MRSVFPVKDNGSLCRPSVQSDPKPLFVAVIPTESNSTRVPVLLDAELDWSTAFARPSQPGAEESGALRRPISPKQTAGTQQDGQLLRSTQPKIFNIRCGRGGFATVCRPDANHATGGER